MNAEISALDRFVAAYHAAIEERLEAIGREKFPFHGDQTPLVYTFRCKDGVATFYANVDDHPWKDTPAGYRVYDESSWTLDLLCQAASFNRLRVLDPQLGDHILGPRKEPAEINEIPDRAKSWMLNHAYIEDCLARRSPQTPFPILGVGPIIHIEGGIRKHVLPSRVHIWSPVVANASGERFRYFQWTYADFWWRPEELGLHTIDPARVAERDLMALQVLASEPDGLDVSESPANSLEQAAAILNKQCEELSDLLRNSGQSEEALHQWLAAVNHRLFLDPAAKVVRSKVPFGDKVSDFVIERPSRDYLLVEIEAATTPIFRKSDGEPTHQFNHARQQVKDWQRYIRENLHTVRAELELPGIYEPKGSVVIGRRSSIIGKEAHRRWMDIRGTEVVDVLTYDDLIDRARATADGMRDLL